MSELQAYFWLGMNQRKGTVKTMYGKIFASTFTGSLHGAGPPVLSLWSYVIANAVDSYVELNPDMLVPILGMSEPELLKAIHFLCQPDPKSRSKGYAGRRLIKREGFAYFVPNHLKYRGILNEDDRREYFKLKKRESRQRLSNGSSKTVKNVLDCPGKSNMSTHTEAEAEAEALNASHTLARARRSGVPTLDEVKSWVKGSLFGATEAMAEEFWHHYESAGWVDKNGNQVINAHSKFSSWVLQERKRQHEQSKRHTSEGPSLRRTRSAAERNAKIIGADAIRERIRNEAEADKDAMPPGYEAES